MDPGLLAVLRVHNPWLTAPERQAELLSATLPEPFVKRRRKLELRPNRAEIVVGPRQAGKSTWIRKSLAAMPQPVLLLHGEEPRIRELCVSAAEALHALSGVLSNDTLLFCEEVQHLDNAGLFLKGLIDLQQRRVVATGSSSFALHARTRESLAGRARRSLLLPFSFDEVITIEPPAELPALREEQRQRAWETLVVRGGYPRVWLDQDPIAELHHLVEAFVLKDTSDMHAIERPAAFRKLLELAAADIGSLVNLSTWAATAGVSRDTVARYLLDLAVDAHILRPLTPFVGGKRAEVTSTPKLYFVDNGLRNTMFGGFEPVNRRADRGALWENAVFSEVLKRLDLLDTIHYWRSKNGAEVDFVLERRGTLIGIEVKATELDRPRLSRGARSFINAYAPARFGVINAGFHGEQEIGNTPVLFRRPWELDDLLD